MSGVAPIVLSIQVCDSVVVDRFTGRASVLNILETISASQYPARHHLLVFFCELTNGHGKAQVDIKLVDVRENDKVIAAIKGPIIFKDVKQIARFIMNFEGIMFPHEGEYRFQLFLNNELKAERRLICKQIEIKKKSKE